MRDGIILLALCQSNYCAAAAGPLTNAQAHLRNGFTDENFRRSELSKGAQQPQLNHNDAGISLDRKPLSAHTIPAHTFQRMPSIAREVCAIHPSLVGGFTAL